MSNRIRAVLPVAMVVYYLAGATFEPRSGEPAAASSIWQGGPNLVQETEPEQSYVGSDACFTCHRPQGGSWSETKHAKAFENLPAKYRNDSSCLKCHITAFGEPGGYLPGMTGEEALPFQNVGCEACHGPGAAHVEAVKLWTLAEPAEEARLLEGIKTAILKTPSDSQCAVCHKTQTHQSHPPYEGQPLQLVNAGQSQVHVTTSAGVVLPPTPDSYNVKTCGSCHYEQYKQWRNETHSALSVGLPANYLSNEDCLKCHRKLSDSTEWFTPNPQTEVNQVGVGCESCHGSGFNHVMFNRQYISGPRLSPELEQAARESIGGEKPATNCLNCHVREGHLEHPKFEKPDAAVSESTARR